MAKIKIKQIKPKVKIIREIGTEETPKAEVSSSEEFHEDEQESFSPTQETFVEGPRRVFIPQTTPGSVREEIEREEATVGPLYDVGRALGGAATGNEDKMYRPVEQIHTDKLQEASIGRGLAMAQDNSPLVESQMMADTERKMREDVEKKYEHGGMESAEHKGRRRYPWEV